MTTFPENTDIGWLEHAARAFEPAPQPVGHPRRPRAACALAGNFSAAGVDVVVADALTPETVALYRDLLPGCLVVHLRVPIEQARRRAATRPVWLTDEEFDALHATDASVDLAVDLAADHVLDTADLDPDGLAAAVEAVWHVH